MSETPLSHIHKRWGRGPTEEEDLAFWKKLREARDKLTKENKPITIPHLVAETGSNKHTIKRLLERRPAWAHQLKVVRTKSKGRRSFYAFPPTQKSPA